MYENWVWEAGLTLQVVVIRRHCGMTRGGAERYCANLCKGLVQLGHEVIFMGESCEADLLDFVRFVPIKRMKLGSASKNWVFHLRVQREMRKFPNAVSLALNRTFPVDVYRLTDPLHAHTISVKYSSRLGKLWTRISLRHRVLLGLERGIFSEGGSRAIITISKLDKKIVQRYYHVSPYRIHVIYNGVDRNIFNQRVRSNREELRIRLGIPPEMTCYLFPARDFRRKGLKNLLNALSKLQFPWVLLVAGDDKPNKYIKLARRMNIESRVKFLGGRRDINRLYGAADLMVFPADYEPFGSVHLEALACGLPVLTTRQVGGSEIVRPNETGYVIDKGSDIEEMVSVFNDHEQKRAEWKAMSESAAKSVEEFTSDRNARLVEQILLRIAEKKASGMS